MAKKTAKKTVKRLTDQEFEALLAEADKKNREKADQATTELNQIKDRAAELVEIFGSLKTTDPETHKALLKAVQAATKKNESIAQVKKRLNALSAAGNKLFKTVGNLSTGGALSMIEGLLKK